MGRASPQGTRTSERSPEQEQTWQQVRRTVLERDGWRCRECGERPRRDELDVHHLVPRRVGGADRASNCITLCDRCHGRRHPGLHVSLAARALQRGALALARFVDRGRALPPEMRALRAGLHLFGVSRFREGQMDSVLTALRGESQLIVRPTSAGKSLCFQLPAVLRGQPVTFVLCPLKSLMVEQTEKLHARGLPASFINGDISGAEKEARYQLLEQGAFSLMYMAPERFGEMVAPSEVTKLYTHRPSFLVVDEAHLVDRWGRDFRAQYGRIAEIRRRLGDPPVIACTATASRETQRRILDSLGIPDARVYVAGADRPNITMARLRERSDRRRAEIVCALLGKLDGRALIFIPTRKVGREAQQALAGAGVRLPLFHGRLDGLRRDELQGRLKGMLDPPLHALITTSACAMGLDIPDVRLVVHWQHPASVEDYLQEMGRAGRDGKPALALLFTTERDTGLLDFMAEKTCEQAIAEGVRTAEEARKTLSVRKAEIREMHRLAVHSEHCFRAGLLEALEGPRRRRRRGATRWLLDLAFATSTPVQGANACCEHCDPLLTERIRSGAHPIGAKQARAEQRPRL